MFEQLEELARELDELEVRLPDVYSSGDQAAARDAGRRHAELKPIVEAYRAYRGAEQDLEDAREMLSVESDAEMREYLRAEIGEKEVARRRARRRAARAPACRAIPTTART